MPDVFDTLDAPKSDIFDSLGAPQADIFDSLDAPPAPGLDLAGENQIRAKLGYSQLPPEGSPEYQAELDKASGGHVTDSQAMQSLEQDIINRRSNSPEWLQPIEHSLKANLVPIGAHPEKLIEGAVPVVEAYQDAKRLFTDPKSFLGPTATSGKFSPVDLSQQQNLDELVGHVLGGAPAVHGVRTGLAARKGTVEAPTAPPEAPQPRPERPSEPSAPEAPPRRTEAAPAEETPSAPSSAPIEPAIISPEVIPPDARVTDGRFTYRREGDGWRVETKRGSISGADISVINPAQISKLDALYRAAEAPKPPAPIGITETLAELTRRNAPEPPLPYREQPAKIPSQDEFARELPSQQAGGAENVSGQQRQAADTGKPGVGLPENPALGGERGRAAESGPAGTSNRLNTEIHGEDAVPGGKGVDTTQLLDNARASLRSGAVDPYSVLSRTRANGIANAEEYAALAAEHERLVNDAVAKQKANDPSAPEAAKAAEDFANAIQPHKTAASDLMRLFQGDLNYDLSTPFGMNEYMKAELGRGMKPAEVPKFEHHARNIRQAESNAQQAVGRADVRVRQRYAKVRDIPIEEAAARVKSWLKDCVV